MNYKIISYVLVLILICGLAFALGVEVGVEQTIKKALNVMPLFVNFTIDEHAIRGALFQYNNNIGGCMFTNDTLLK